MSEPKKLDKLPDADKLIKIPKGFFAQLDTGSSEEIAGADAAAGWTTSPGHQSGPNWDAGDAGWDW